MQSGDTVAGKYRLSHPLGSGGMAEVWAATNAFTERQVAIKFMSPSMAKTPEAAARFLKEAKVSARVNHPNIIDVLDVGQAEDGQLFLVMELLAGMPLEAAMRRQPPMTVLELTRFMLEVGEALAAAHKAGIVHRDLKPSNVFLHATKDGVASKLLDFGVSKFLEEDTNHALTVAGTVLGSPLYMSPEQARGETNLDGRTDVFAFGAILFEALCGYRPYEGKNFNALIVKIATTKPKSIDACAPHVPESLRRVVRACMETDLAARAQSFDVVLAMLREALPELETSQLRLATSVLGPTDASVTPMQHAAPGSSDAWRSPSPPSAWQTPNTSYASIISIPPTNDRRSSGRVVAACAALATAVIVLGAVVATRPRATTATTTRAPEPTTLAATIVPTASPAPTTPEVPTVSVDALPGAKAKGHLAVSIASGRCAVTVDGKDRGTTPLTVDVAPGTHRVTCKADGIKLLAASVVVTDNATAKICFGCED